MYPGVMLLTDEYCHTPPGVLETGKSCFNGKLFLHSTNSGSNSDSYVSKIATFLLISKTAGISNRHLYSNQTPASSRTFIGSDEIGH